MLVLEFLRQLIELGQYQLMHGCDVEPPLLAYAQQSVDAIALRGLRDLLRHAPCYQLSAAPLVTVSPGGWRVMHAYICPKMDTG